MEPRPIQWIEEASPEEIGEAILAVDRLKAAAVCRYLMDRVAQELAQLSEQIEHRMKTDPLGTLGGALLGAIRGGSGGR